VRTSDSRDVALRFLRPRTEIMILRVVLDLQVSGAHHLEGVVAVEQATAGVWDVKTGLRVEYRYGEVHVDAAQCVHDARECIEIQFDVMIDRYREVFFDRGGQLAGSLVKSGVNFVGSRLAGVRDEEVARYRQQSELTRGGVDVHDHDDVAVDAVHAVLAKSVGLVLDLQRTSIGGADEQDILGPVRALDVAHVNVVDLRAEVEVVGDYPQDQYQDQAEHAEDDESSPTHAVPSSVGRTTPGRGFRGEPTVYGGAQRLEAFTIRHPLWRRALRCHVDSPWGLTSYEGP